jgi:hypothetical protein
MPATGIKGIALSWFVTRPGGAYLISHGGTTNGQVAELYICREKNYAALGFANGEFGRMVLGPALENALRHYCGVQHPVPKPGKQPASIKEYLGTYLTHFMSYTLFTDRKGLQLSYKYGNPEYQKKYGSGDLMRMGFYGKDKVMLLGAKYRGNYGEFLRDDKGRVRWLRLFLRVHPKKK